MLTLLKYSAVTFALVFHFHPCHTEDGVVASEKAQLDLENVEDGDNQGGKISENTDLELVEEGEDIENEEHLRCAQDVNLNIYRVLKHVLPGTGSDRESRQEDTENVDPNDLVQSMLNLEVSQILGPVLRIIGSAAANNATAIDENYNKLPFAVRYQVTDFIKFTVDLLTTTELEGLHGIYEQRSPLAQCRRNGKVPDSAKESVQIFTCILPCKMADA